MLPGIGGKGLDRFLTKRKKFHKRSNAKTKQGKNRED